MFVLGTLIIISINIYLSSTELVATKDNRNSVGLETFLEVYLDRNAVNVFITDDQNDLDSSLNDAPFYKINSTYFRPFLDTIQNKPRVCIIFINNINTLDEIVTNHSDVLIGTSEYLVITMEDELVHSIAETLWKARLFYSYIISTGNLYRLDIRDCGLEVSAKHIAILNKNTHIGDVQTWDIKTRFKNCPIYAAWALMPPFVNSINISWAGIYIDVMKVFSFYSGREIVYRPYNPVYLEEISLAYYYGTLLDDFDSEYVQIFIGPTDIQASTILDTSPIIFENDILFLVPKPIMTYWQKLYSVHLFEKIIINIFIQVFFITAFYYLVKKSADKKIFKSKSHTFFLFFGLLVNSNPLRSLPKNRILRTYLGIYILQMMVFSMLIQGILVSSLSGSLYGNPIKNVDKLLDSNLPIKVVNSMNFLFQISKDEKDLEVYKRLETMEEVGYPFQAGNIAIRSRNFATLIDTGFLTMRPNILKSFSVFKVYLWKQTMAMPKNAYFTNQYNEWFQRIIEIGIISKYKNLYEHFYALTYFVEEDKRNFVVTFKQIQYVLILAAAGYFISFIVFLGEIFIGMWKVYFKRHQNY